MTDRSELILTVSPRLDAALQIGWEGWLTAARDAGATAVATWIARRSGDPASRHAMLPAVEELLSAISVEGQIEPGIELAELMEEVDDLVADTLWEGVLLAGQASDDADTVFEATARLAAIAEAHADPLAAAEYWIDALNWRRQAERVSDAEQIEAAFEEIIRLAALDGAPREAALFSYRQAQYTRLVEAEDDRATTGNWEESSAPYPSWA